MKAFVTYMDGIHAEKERKEKTEAFVRDALAKAREKEDGQLHGSEEKEKTPVKRWIIAVSGIAACAALTLGGYAFYNTPVKYVSLDINPSVELGVNPLDRVVTAEAYNEDGELILEGAGITGQPVAEALDGLIREAAEQGFIQEDGSTVIAVTAESDDGETAEELQGESEEAVAQSLDGQDAEAVVYGANVPLQIRDAAKENGLSPGKYKLYTLLKELNPDIQPEDVRNTKITDLITQANELLSQSGNGGETNGEEAGEIIRIRDAARLVAIARMAEHPNENGQGGVNGNGQGLGLTKQNQEQEQSQDGTGQEDEDTPEQEQEQAQEEEQEQEQSANGSGKEKSENKDNNGNGSNSKKEAEQEQNQNTGTEGAEEEQEQNQNQVSGGQSNNGNGQGASGSGNSSSGNGNSSGSGSGNSGDTGNGNGNSGGSGGGRGN